MPKPETKGHFVTCRNDPTQADGLMIYNPFVALDVPAEFPRKDEHFSTTAYEYVWLNVFIPQKADSSKNIYQGLNGQAMHSNMTGQTQWFYAGDDLQIQEPIFIPRTTDAPERVGWVMAPTWTSATMRHCRD